MIRVWLSLLVVAGGAWSVQKAPSGRSTEELLRLSCLETPEGARARALLVNQAAARAEEIIAALSGGDEDVRVAAAWVLRACAHPKAIPALEAALRDENFSVARTAASTLKEKKAADKPLAAMLEDEDPAMRWRAAANIGHVSAVGAAPALIKVATSDPADYVRMEAVASMTIAPTAEAATSLVRCFLDASPRVRDQAAASFDAVFARLSESDRPAQARVVGALLGVLEDHRDKPFAIRLALERLSSILLKRLGEDPLKWRGALATRPAATEASK
jgi:HEAT repeat protein